MRRLLCLMFLAATAAGMGCAPSAKIAYARHLAAVVRPGPAADDEVAVAFRLDQYARPSQAVADRTGGRFEPLDTGLYNGTR